ncbi:MAG: Ribosomal-protein-S18p-alanine acetyltransferase, partial [uncultured Solirubrobacteraceae bacterium]
AGPPGGPRRRAGDHGGVRARGRGGDAGRRAASRSRGASRALRPADRAGRAGRHLGPGGRTPDRRSCRVAGDARPRGPSDVRGHRRRGAWPGRGTGAGHRGHRARPRERRPQGGARGLARQRPGDHAVRVGGLRGGGAAPRPLPAPRRVPALVPAHGAPHRATRRGPSPGL